MPSLTQIWQQAQPFIKQEIGPTSYETWFTTLKAKEEDGLLILETPDEFFQNWIIDHYQTIILNTLEKIHGSKPTLKFTINPTLFRPETRDKLEHFESGFMRPKHPSRLNPRFSFNNFVVGPSNRFCYAACLAVAESPAKAYNPLFIYGAVGLGKTHLMQAIAQHIQKLHPNCNVFYTSSEDFTNELIDAIRHRSTTQFRQKYRNFDVLLIDDIHFIAGKESTQEEFFHTFNALHNNRKQIIISSDRPPKDIANLEERLVSRFAWGLITDIQPPDYETRLAILRKKCEQESVLVPEDVLIFIAEQITTNIRELEGALVRVVAYALMEDRPVTLEVARMVLKDMVVETARRVNPDEIIQTVSRFFNIPVEDIKAKKRQRAVMHARQMAMYLCRSLTAMSLPEIGRYFGGKDHTTVLHSCRKIESELKKRSELKRELERLQQLLQKA